MVNRVLMFHILKIVRSTESLSHSLFTPKNSKLCSGQAPVFNNVFPIHIEANIYMVILNYRYSLKITTWFQYFLNNRLCKIFERFILLSATIPFLFPPV
jgi:hypothetical protein